MANAAIMALRAWLLAAMLGLASGSWWSRTDEVKDRLATLSGKVADINPVDVEDMQKKWGEGIVELGELFQTHSAYHLRKRAHEFVEEVYGSDFSNVIVKPTGVLHKPFRDSIRGVVSWLIGQDEEFPQDRGFAKSRWRKVRFRNAGISLTGNEALAMGNSFFTDAVTGHEVRAEYTMGFIRDADEEIRMNLHFSSFPYVNNSETTQSEGISQDDIEEAQISFVNQIIRIGRRKHIRERVEKFVDRTFAYGSGEVLFKPPDAEEKSFRTTRYGIYSYFGGGSDDYPHEYPEDRGFVAEEWSTGKFHNAGVVLEGEEAWAMGLYTFSREDGEQFSAEYVMGYIRDSEGRLRINLFSASIPSKVESHSRRRRREREHCWGAKVSASAIEELQRKWAEGIIEIGSTYATKGDYRRRAEQFVDQLYAYQFRPVLYKPADASGRQAFRTSREGAISYFVGDDRSFPDDEGFARQCWEHVHFTNVDVLYAVDMAISMGFVSYASSNGIWRRAEITMGFILDDEGELRINMQHATFPDRARRFEFMTENRVSSPRSGISEALIDGAQEEWGHWVVRIGEAQKNWTNARVLAEGMMDELYDFSGGQVLFSVIDAPNSSRFRYTRREAISFFVGGDCNLEDDRGFALEQPWSKVRFKNRGIKILNDRRANVFGTSYFCCDHSGEEKEVDYTMSYVSDVDGRLRLFLHDMSYPYEAEDAPSLGVIFSGVSRHASSLAKSVGVVGSGGTSSVAVVFLLPLVAGLFLYFACCWSAGKLGAGARQPVGTAGPADYLYDNDNGPGYGKPNGSGYAGVQRGGYSRAAGSGNGYAPSAGFGYQDPAYGMQAQYASQSSMYQNQYEQVPSRNFYPQPGQSRRSMNPSNPARSSWRTATAMPQRAYNMS